MQKYGLGHNWRTGAALISFSYNGPKPSKYACSLKYYVDVNRKCVKVLHPCNIKLIALKCLPL